jgi:ABC-type transport system substrate-binding protein
MRFSEANKRRFGRIWKLVALLGVVLMLAGCVPAQPTAPSAGSAASGGAPQVASPSAGTKTLRLGTNARNWPKDGIIDFADIGTVGNAEDKFIFHAGLTAYDPQSAVVPRAAMKVPSLNDGDWNLLPDGQMEVTWKLRPNVKWHDGVALTAGDFAFGLRAIQDSEFPDTRTEWSQSITDITAPDPSTLVVRWKQPHIYGNVSGPSDIPALPRHLMGDLYESSSIVRTGRASLLG